MNGAKEICNDETESENTRKFTFKKILPALNSMGRISISLERSWLNSISFMIIENVYCTLNQLRRLMN